MCAEQRRVPSSGSTPEEHRTLLPQALAYPAPDNARQWSEDPPGGAVDECACALISICTALESRVSQSKIVAQLGRIAIRANWAQSLRAGIS